MTKYICFATNNKGKLAEAQLLLNGLFHVVGLSDIGCRQELPETHDTIPENSAEKAQFVASTFHVNCFADDSGLEVSALDMRPGVHSAYYAGPQRSDADNIAKVLQELEGQSDRRARFRTVVTLVNNGKQHVFEGTAEGMITHAPQGVGGFGYDPIFIPDGFTRTFAEMTKEEKNSISHRGKAVRALIDFLKMPNA